MLGGAGAAAQYPEPHGTAILLSLLPCRVGYAGIGVS